MSSTLFRLRRGSHSRWTGATALRACRLAGVRFGDEILVLGCGPLGYLIAQICKVMGSNVTLVGRGRRMDRIAEMDAGIDAPYHFMENGRTVDQIDLRQLQGAAVVVDLYDKNPDEPITDADLDKYDARIDRESIVLLFSLAGNEFEKAVPPHIELLQSDIWIIEDMFLPRELLECDNWHVIALPMLLKGGSGGPVRVIAVEYCEDDGETARQLKEKS